MLRSTAFPLVPALGSTNSPADCSAAVRPASRLLWRGLTSRARASSASAPRLPDATARLHQLTASRETSRFPFKERARMPGSTTTPGRTCARVGAPMRVAFRRDDGVGTRVHASLAAQWPARMYPCRRFALVLANDDARLGASAVRYPFTARTFALHTPCRSPGAPSRSMKAAAPAGPPSPSRRIHASQWTCMDAPQDEGGANIRSLASRAASSMVMNTAPSAASLSTRSSKDSIR